MVQVIPVNGRYHVEVARNSVVRVSCLLVILFGFGLGAGITLAVSSELRDVLQATEHSKALIRSAAAMTVENQKAIEDFRSRCQL